MGKGVFRCTVGNRVLMDASISNKESKASDSSHVVCSQPIRVPTANHGGFYTISINITIFICI